MRTFAIAFLMICYGSVAQAGVDFYSGTQNVELNGVGTPTPSWSPVTGTATGASAIQFATEYSAALFLKDGSTLPYSAYFTQTSGGKLETVSGTFSSSDPSLQSSSAIIADDVNNRANGYVPTSNDNFFGWSVKTGTTDLYVGWARFDYDPDPPASNQADKFIIVDWAYNLVSSSATITVGDTTLNNSGVPEPGSLAVFGLIGLGAIASRRRR